MKRLASKKWTCLSLRGSQFVLAVLLLIVVIFAGFILIGENPICHEWTPESTDAKTPAGVQCQVRLSGTDSATPKLRFQVLYTGDRTFGGYMSTEIGFAIRIDSRWYHWLGEIDIKSTSFAPGSIYTDSIDLSNPDWGIELVPGKHAVQIAILLADPGWRSCFWIPSNILSMTFSNR